EEHLAQGLPIGGGKCCVVDLDAVPVDESPQALAAPGLEVAVVVERATEVEQDGARGGGAGRRHVEAAGPAGGAGWAATNRPSRSRSEATPCIACSTLATWAHSSRLPAKQARLKSSVEA